MGALMYGEKKYHQAANHTFGLYVQLDLLTRGTNLINYDLSARSLKGNMFPKC